MSDSAGNSPDTPDPRGADGLAAGEHGDGPAQKSQDPNGPVFYLFRNLGRMLWGNLYLRRFLKLLPILAVATVFLGRVMLYPILIQCRRNVPWLVFVLVTGGTLILIHLVPTRHRGARLLFTAAVLGLWIGLAILPFNLFYELSLAQGFSRIQKVELQRLPLTRKERIYPLAMVQRIAEDRLTDSHYSVERFSLMLHDGSLRWVAAKTPMGLLNRITLEEITGLVSVEASRETVELKHYDASFKYGPDLPFFKNLNRYALPWKLGFLDLFDKELDDHVIYLRIGERDWIQVVGLIDWEGVFPCAVPTFEGVFVIPTQGHGSIRFLTPDQIKADPELRGQNLLPEKISAFYAESWEFNQGISGWLQNRGVTKITTIPEDTNQQPFTVYFDDVGTDSGLFQFYALEPDGPSAGLSKILLFDPHGYEEEPRVYFFDFDVHGMGLVGPARIAETIRASDLHADWKQKNTGTFIIAESRPYIKDEPGKPRSFHWFNSIITSEHGSNLPIIVIADPNTLKVEWYEGERVKTLLDH